MDDHGVVAAFPHEPYDIQRDFMVALYETLERRQIGLFESPTGTGKTLSIICATLKWLEDQRRAEEERNQHEAQAAGQGLPAWMRSFDPMAAAAMWDMPQRPKNTAHQRGRPAGQIPASSHSQQQQRRPARSTVALTDSDGTDLSEFLVPNEISVGVKRGGPADSGSSGASSEDEGSGASRGREPRPLPPPRKPQVIFCSRTHSQLSQFVGELHRTRFAGSLSLVAVASRRALCVNDQVAKLSDLSAINEHCLDLQQSRRRASGNSRKAAAASCTIGSDGASGAPGRTPGLAQLGAARRHAKAAKGGCPFLKRGGSGADAAGPDAMERFKDAVLAAPADVEELAQMGRSQQVCPYYGSRMAVPQADIILAPYSALLSSDARSALGLDPEGSVLVFDEAHNLLDAVNSAHGGSITGWQLACAQRQVAAYHERFRAALSPSNLQHVHLLLRVTAALLAHLGARVADAVPGAPGPSAAAAAGAPPPEGTAAGGAVPAAPAAAGPQQRVARGGGRAAALPVNQLMFALGLDNVNVFSLLRWMRETKFAFKVAGYTAAAAAKSGLVQLAARGGSDGGGGGADSTPAGAGGTQGGLAAMHALASFLAALTNTDDDGRVIVEPPAAADAVSAGGGEAGGNGAAAAAAAAAAGGTPAAGRTGTVPRSGRLRFVLLDAARHFGHLLSSAHAVVLASGTLAPVSSLRAQLFPHEPPHRVRHFECGHVVAPDQLLALAVGRGPAGRPLDFRHAARRDDAVADEAGALLLNLCAVVPAGCVAFAPSFSYLDSLVSRWRGTGLLARLAGRKAVFVEPRGAADLEAVLGAYAAAALGAGAGTCTGGTGGTDGGKGATSAGGQHDSGAGRDQAPGGAASRLPPLGLPPGAAVAAVPGASGALLLCVIGGKLSEGINFGDGLGRCVVVLGLPYANPTDPELAERMRHLDDAAAAWSGGAIAGHAPLPGPGPGQGGPNRQPHQHHQQQQQGPPVPAVTQQAQQSGQQAQQGSQKQGAARPLVGAQYYEDLCFRAVNQAIGRAVRHRRDYAAIVLVDQRWAAPMGKAVQLPPAVTSAVYQQQQQQQQERGSGGATAGRAHVVTRLPGWVQRSFITTPGDFGSAYCRLAAFFKARAEAERTEAACTSAVAAAATAVG